MKKLLILAALFLVATTAFAHSRDFIANYGYETLKHQKVESELFIDYASDQGATQFADYRLNFIYGVDDNWELGVQGSLRQAPSGSTGYNNTKVALQYRFSEGECFLGRPAVYLSYAQPNSQTLRGRTEGILIFQKVYPGWETVANFKMIDYDFSDVIDFRFGVGLGAAKDVTPNLKVGLEWKGERLFVPDEQENYLVPGAYIKVQNNMYWNIGMAFGLNPRSYDFTIMSLLHYEF